ncbi:MAG: DUF4159 domain-containing protein, partial [Rhodospirillales bacterium]|nr:DUF4159 domain-containing protein [Rhodospirillales bacterium]
LTTAPDADGRPPAVIAPRPLAALRTRLAAVAPQPWPADRAASASALASFLAAGHRRGMGVAYIADGLTDGPAAAWRRFAAELGRVGPVTVLQDAEPQAVLMLPPRSQADAVVARLARVAQPQPAAYDVLAQAGAGRTLARVTAHFAAGASRASVPVVLPTTLRNRLDRLVLAASAPRPGATAGTVVRSAGSVALLDERWRRRPVGLVAGNALTASTPLLGPLYYLERAMSPFAELHTGTIQSLLASPLSMLVLADVPLPPGPDRAAVDRFVAHGGLLLRFAGPETAAHPDPLVPVKLLAGDRRLGGAMSWTRPQALQAFVPASPFFGLPVPRDVHVRRQVLAQPGLGLSGHVWASLADGTPLVTAARRGQGRLVLVHTTANADWSDLPLSGLFVSMLQRLTMLSSGVAEVAGNQPLAPAATLSGYGELGPPPPRAGAVVAARIGATPVSPLHPPGFYGPPAGRRALDLGAATSPPEAAPAIPGARVVPLGLPPRARSLGPWLLALATILLAIDLLVALVLRGLLRRPAVAAMLLAASLALPLATAHAQTPPTAPPTAPRTAPPAAPPMAPGTHRPVPPPLPTSIPPAALRTTLGYIVTGDAAVDRVSREGLAALSVFVTAHTAARLGPPQGVVPGRDDLSFYPLLYWPITPAQPDLSAAAVAALNSYMGFGGIILIDTRDGAAGFAPGARQALRRLARGLVIPALAPLTTEHVLTRTFFLLPQFPGRYPSGTVWVQRGQDRANDSVSPVVIGGGDWAAAWASDASGRFLYAVIPGGDRQRVFAYRFGVNLVMYALTGNYKGDQVHVPAILQRLGQ